MKKASWITDFEVWVYGWLCHFGSILGTSWHGLEEATHLMVVRKQTGGGKGQIKRTPLNALFLLSRQLSCDSLDGQYIDEIRVTSHLQRPHLWPPLHWDPSPQYISLQTQTITYALSQIPTSQGPTTSQEGVVLALIFVWEQLFRGGVNPEFHSISKVIAVPSRTSYTRDIRVLI